MTADAIYDTDEIRKCNRRRGIKSNIPVNKRNQKKRKRGRHKGRSGRDKKESVVERFFSWIESCKKVFPRHEIKEISYLRGVMVTAIIKLNQVLGGAHFFICFIGKIY